MRRLASFPAALGLGLVLASAGPAASASTAPSGPVPPGNRFLFVVDTSAAMSSLAYASRQALVELIFSGVEDQMQQGDTFGLWTFDEEPRTGIYPMQTWQPEKNLDLAGEAGRFLRERPYAKKSDLTSVLVKLGTVMRSVGDLNVFIITDGVPPGTNAPLYQKLYAGCKEKAAVQRKAQKPFLLVLASRGGQLVQATVHLPGEPIKLPPPPPRPAADLAASKDRDTSQPPSGESGTNASPAAADSSSPSQKAAEVAAPATNRAPIIMTNSPAVLARKVIEIRTVTNPSSTPPATVTAVPTNAVPLAETNPPVVASVVATSTPPAPVAPVALVEPPVVSTNAALVSQTFTNVAGPGASLASPPRKNSPTDVASDGGKDVRSTAQVPVEQFPGRLSKRAGGALLVAARELHPPSPAETQAAPAVTNATLAAIAPGSNGSDDRLWIALGAMVTGAILTLLVLKLWPGRHPYQPSIISRSLDQR